MELGPITIDDPVFMEMSVGGIVSGSSEPVAGIVGFDVFKSSVLEVGPGGSPVRLYDPKTFIPPVTWDWKPLLMVSNVPHVAADFAGAPQGRPQIFMIDSGAGGADCIFHAQGGAGHEPRETAAGYPSVLLACARGRRERRGEQRRDAGLPRVPRLARAVLRAAVRDDWRRVRMLERFGRGEIYFYFHTGD